MIMTLSLWVVVTVFGIQPASSIWDHSRYDWDILENHTNYHLLYWGKDCGETWANRPNEVPTNYIHEGKVMEQGQYPWVVLIKPGGAGSVCTGSILNKWWILTAARCRISTKMWIWLSFFAAGYAGPNGHEREVAERIIHESSGLEDDTPLHNIMLLRVGYQIEYTRYIQPICMVPPNHRHCLDESKGVYAAGWAQPAITEKSEKPKYAYMHLLPYTTCENVSQRERLTFHHEFQLCTESLNISGFGGTLCDGDIGAPLFKRTTIGSSTKRAYQLGVFSHTPYCKSIETTKKVSYYSKLSYYILWILDNIRDISS